VHTDVTHFAFAPARATNGTVVPSSIAAIWPLPPGAKITSSGGASSNVTVGVIVNPVSEVTGSRVRERR